MATPPDRATILAAVMPALLAAQAPTTAIETDEVGVDEVVAIAGGIVVGLPVAREAFARLGARCRPLVDDGTSVAAGAVVAELGGPVAAIRRAAPVAIGFLERLSAVASGVTDPDPEDGLERYATAVAAARLSPSAAVDHDGPSFRLGSEG